MRNGFYRVGIVLSVVWIISICSFALYEWQASFTNKAVFFIVVPHPEAVGADGAIPVTTQFLIERFISIIALPLIGFWLLLLARPAFIWIRNGFSSKGNPAGGAMFCSQCGTKLNTDSNYCSKCGKPIPDQSQSAAPSTVDSPMPQQRQLEPAPQTQQRFKLKGFIKRAWNGEERLWIVFWIYNILGGWLFILIQKFLLAYGVAVEEDGHSASGIAVAMGITAVLCAFYLIWAWSSLWKCAFNVKQKLLGYLARAFVVWGIGVFVFLTWVLLS